MEPTDTARLKLPQVVIEQIGDREESVVDQRISVDLDWWNRRLKDHAVAGGTITTEDELGRTVESGKRSLTRGDVFAVAGTNLEDPENVCRLLWYSLAWGAGPSRRLCDQRVAAVRDGGGFVIDGLVKAASLSRCDPGDAYATVCPSTSRNLVKYLGPAFATKFLYFAGAGEAGHPSLILDRLVATALRDRCGWDSLSPDWGWPSGTYARYCELLNRWSEEASDQLGRRIAADELEVALFRIGKAS